MPDLFKTFNATSLVGGFDLKYASYIQYFPLFLEKKIGGFPNSKSKFHLFPILSLVFVRLFVQHDNGL